MGGKERSLNHSKARPCPGRKTLKRCKSNGKTDNAVFIDVDCEGLNNVIVIDVPESLPNKFFGSSSLKKDKISPYVICVDDDESTDDINCGMGVKGDESVDIDPSFGVRPCPSSNLPQDSVDAADDECQFVQENLSPVKLSKCKRTYSGKASTRNRYGFRTKLDGDSSDYESPDCEFMEDSFGSIKEQWEKAFYKKKFDICSGRSGIPDCASASRFCYDANENIRADNKADRHPEAPVFTGRCEKEDWASFVAKCAETLGTTPKDSQEAHDDYLLRTIFGRQYTNAKADALERPDLLSEGMFESELFSSSSKNSYTSAGDAMGEAGFSCDFTARKNNQCFGSGSDGVDDQHLHGMASSSKHEDTKKVHQSEKLFHHIGETQPEEPSLSKPVSSANKKFCQSETSFPDQEANYGCNLQDEPVAQESLFWDSQSSDKTQSIHIASSTDDKVEAAFGDSFLQRSSSVDTSERNEEDCLDDNGETSPEGPIFSDLGPNEAQLEPGKSAVGLEQELTESASNSQPEVTRDNLDASDGFDAQQSIINKREKLKDTDEYKRALEEELASRERALRIQAEEAQRLRQLRKRIKAESMRLSDMERRQRQRVAEVRESQKKDEENMNQRELLRIEVRKELTELELMCHDMASLLHGLGVSVSGFPDSSPHEVRVAYKRALLTFHPDRASRSDIRQQVEAEEKFKLISCMKEKFLPT